MRPTFEETLSWLTGLAPVGQPFEVPLAWAIADLRLRTRSNWHVRLNGLINAGCVRRLATASGRSTGLLVVVRALEPGRTAQAPARSSVMDLVEQAGAAA